MATRDGGTTRRLLALFAACLILAASLLPRLSHASAVHKAAAKTMHQAVHHPRLLFIGDSLTAGLYASDTNHSYAARLTALLDGQRVNAPADYGISALQVASLLPQRTASLPRANVVRTLFAPFDDTEGDQRATSLPRANVLIVELGTNDFGEVPTTTFRPAYESLIATLKHQEPGAQFVCLGVWRSPQPEPGALYGGALYDAMIDQLCPGQFVSLALLYMTWSYHGPQGQTTYRGVADWFHPNDAGHAAIAQAILTLLGVPDATNTRR